MRVELTQGEFAIIDPSDFELVRGYSWYAARRGNRVYAATAYTVEGKKHHVHMHRLLLDAPKGSIVIHLNGDTLDNRRENLHLSLTGLSAGPSWGKSRFRGVSWNATSGAWRAEIQFGGVKRFLGLFSTETEAAQAYAEEAERISREMSSGR